MIRTFQKWSHFDQASTEFKKYIIWFWKLALYGTGFIILLFILAGIGAFGKMPSFERLENPDNNLATEIIGSDDRIIGTFAVENRTPVHYSELPKNLIDALVSTEDERFYKHSGIDFRGTMRAVLKLGSDGGASTITQQLAKMMFTKRMNSNKVTRLFQKVKEIIIAIRLEKRYSKDEIVAMYLNQYDFLNQAVGIRSASRIYFGKEPNELQVQESAMLVGMLKNSALYNPLKKKRIELVKDRRNTVFGQMYRNDKISKAEMESLEKMDLGLNVHRESHKEGLAPYFREYLRAYMQEWIEKNPKADGSKYDLYTDGLKIYVSIDSRMQEYAEEAVSAHMANLQEAFFKEQKTNKTAPFRSLTTEEIEKTINRAMRVSDRWRKMKEAGITEKEIIASFDKKTEMSVFSWKGEIDTIMTPRDSIFYYKHFLRTGFVAIEPQTGLVKAWVGGVDYRHFMYDAVEKQKRQVGSTFKPFVYITAINQMQLSPCNVYPNSRYTIPAGKYGLPQDWSPDNSDGNYGGTYTLKSALANSVNVISARLIDEVTPTTVAELANRAGVKSEIPHVPSICLGSVELSLYELISAMGSFANKGQHVEPIVVLRIQDKNGVVLEEFVPESSEVVSEESSYVLMEMMKGVTESGTGARLRGNWTSGGSLITGHPYNFTNPIAGKTGTTQNQSDGWFVGIVPNLIAGVWVGGEDRSIHFRNIDKGQGATMALPIWALFMKKCYADPTLKVSKDDFPRPAVLNIEMDCSKVSNTMDVGDPNYPEQGAIEF